MRVGRVQIFNNWSPYMVADRQNTVWIGLEYFVNEGGDLWVMPDQQMIDLGIREMEAIGMIRKEDVLDGCVLRMPKAYPAYIGSYDQLHVVRDFVSKIPNLYPGRPQRHAPLQQPGSQHAYGDDRGRQHRRGPHGHG